MEELKKLITEALTHDTDSIVSAAGKYLSFVQKMKHNPATKSIAQQVVDTEASKAEADILTANQHPLTDKHSNNIRTYTKTSTGVNGHLINNTYNPGRAGQARNISETIQKHTQPLPHETHVYSGLGKFDPTHIMETGKFHTPAFTSTSLTPNVATGFLSAKGSSNLRKESHLVHYVLPKGYSKSIQINDHSEWPNEHEHLLDKGQTWKVTGKTEHNVTPEHKIHIWSVVPHDAKEQ